MAMPSGRPLLTASLNEETLDRIRRFVAEQGISMSALIEAYGRQLPDLDEPISRACRRTVNIARSIDADRRRRSRRT